MSHTIDLRSDTLTKPSDAMRRAMAQAEVGDDMFGEDPTVRKLEDRFCEITGMAAALFVPSGTMANQLAIRSQTEPGDEVITHPDSHIIHYESGAPAAIAGVMIQPAPGPRGLFTAEQVRALVRSDDQHNAVSKLVTVENTHNRGGGKVWPIDQLQAVFDAAHDLGLRAHVDGARLWNASIASGESVRAILANADTVSACFSKGLGAPVGSALAGDAPTIGRARRFRKMLGGAMRQAGVLAAAALHALDNHLERLADDHANAKALADRLAEIPGVSLDPATVETNIIYFDIEPDCGPASAVCERCAREGVLMFDTGPSTIRAVTHLHISSADAAQAGERIARALGR